MPDTTISDDLLDRTAEAYGIRRHRPTDLSIPYGVDPSGYLDPEESDASLRARILEVMERHRQTGPAAAATSGETINISVNDGVGTTLVYDTANYSDGGFGYSAAWQVHPQSWQVQPPPQEPDPVYPTIWQHLMEGS